MKWFWRILGILFLFLFGYGIHYCQEALPIISGYNAKIMGSGVFLAGRAENQIRAEDLGYFPLNLASTEVNYKDSTVKATVFGFAEKLSLFRKGAGCTLVNDFSLDSLKKQSWPVHLPIDQSKIQWPLGDLDNRPIPSNIDSNLLSQFIEKEFQEEDSSNKLGTRALLVLYKGQIIAEHYAKGFNTYTPLLGWSMAKSVTSAMTGILVHEGRLNLDSTVLVEEWEGKDDPRKAILLENLLQQNDGLSFEEDYAKHSDVTEMLFERGDMAHFTAEHPLIHKPGQVFNYSSGNVNLLSRIIRRSIGEKSYKDFLFQHLFKPLGMFHSTMEPDPSGTLVGSSYMYASARDWARFGLLYYNHGIIGKDTLLSKDFIQRTLIPPISSKNGQYGYLFWLNLGAKDHPEKRKFKDVPRDAFYADGFEGQIICIIPSRDFILVRLGLSPGKVFNPNRLISKILTCIH